MQGRFRLGLMVVAMAVGAAATAAVPPADAREPWPVWRRGDGYTYYERRRTERPEHGFEGFAGPPMQQSYCSYQRIPNRVCGPKGCRVKDWTLEQYCR
ncbi:MAG: hypothetical protein AB7L90_21825 [Hyphomicrobiaceae bacterium]